MKGKGAPHGGYRAGEALTTAGAHDKMRRHYAAGRSAVRLARLLWEQDVGGSNPLAPTRLAPVAQQERASDF